jgi:hypothetical protein
MKRNTARSLLTASIAGAFVTFYWFLAFYAALTTPLNFGNSHNPPDPWEFIDPIRNSGYYAGMPLVIDDSHPLRAIPIYDNAPIEMQLAILAFSFGLGAMVVTFALSKVGWWLWSRRSLNQEANKSAHPTAGKVSI